MSLRISFSQGEDILSSSEYWFLTGMSVALHRSCHTMARKWCGMPLRISSWRQGQSGGGGVGGWDQEAGLYPIPAQPPHGHLAWPLRSGPPTPHPGPRARPSHCTARDVHEAECAAPAHHGTHGWEAGGCLGCQPLPDLHTHPPGPGKAPRKCPHTSSPALWSCWGPWQTLPVPRLPAQPCRLGHLE